MSAVNLGNAATGTPVKIKIANKAYTWYVIYQGNPSTTYYENASGTWLWLADAYAYGTLAVTNSNVVTNLDSTIKSHLLTPTIMYPYFKRSKETTEYNGTTVTYYPVLATKKTYTGQCFYPSPVECGGAGITKWDCPSFMESSGVITTNYTDGAIIPALAQLASQYGTALRGSYSNASGSNSYSTWNYAPYWSSSGLSFGLNTATRRSGVIIIVDPDGLIISDDALIEASAPSAPSSISVPTSIVGGTSITVSWGASSDSDGDLEGYILERSVDGGTNWSQIYQGSATSTTNTVAYGIETVMYRVKAYDSTNLESGYKTSAQRTVISNTAPTAPSAISVPSSISGGGTVVITWGASTDAEDNLEGYTLERSVDGGSYTEIYDGTSTSYTDTITKGWSTVAYRVKAYDPYTSSSYTTSATRTIDNNTAPVITCNYSNNANIGTKSSGFSVGYSVDDEDGDAVTVTETLDGTVKRAFTATNGTSYSFAVTGDYFQKILNGDHTMVISATDGTATSTLTLSFTKYVTTVAVVLNPAIEADAQITACAVTVSGNIPSDAEMKVEVTNNGNDDNPIWEDCTDESKSGSSYTFVNETAERGYAFNLRVTVSRGGSDTGGYITSIQGGFQ